MTQGFTSRLGARILFAMGGVMLVFSLIFLSLFTPLYHHQLLKEREVAPVKIGATLEFALQRAMLRRDLQGLREMISDLGKSPGLSQVTILNPAGEARFASNPDQIGKSFDIAKLCPDCATEAGDSVGVGFVTDENVRDVMRSLRPVRNQPICGQCHGPVADHPINGYLLIDYEAADLKNHAWAIAAALAGAGALVVAGALLAALLALRHSVLRPISLLAKAARDFANANFSARDKIREEIVTRGDEIADLGAGFVTMAERLEQTIRDLRRHDAFMQGLIDAIPDGIRVIAPDHSVVAANRAFCQQAGLSLPEVLSRPCYASSHKRAEPCAPTLIVCPLEALGHGVRSVKCSHSHIDATGEILPVEVIAAPMSGSGSDQGLVVEAIRDLSQQAQISHEQRLSELGQLAAGVAHEIHNPLGSIRLGLHAIRREVEAGPKAASVLEFITAANVEIDRSLNVTERLMKLSRTPQDRGALLDVAQSICDATALLRYEAELRNIEIRQDIDEDARIIADESDLGMILVNLMQNALHAMTTGGVLTLSAKVTADRDVDIVVSDTGVGIPQENLRKIFHPFWSWRADGSIGSGLGLAICKSLVEKWNGDITVSSPPGQGAAFELHFPHADKAIPLQ